MRPLMSMMVPMVVIIIHTAVRYEYRPLRLFFDKSGLTNEKVKSFSQRQIKYRKSG